MTSNTNQFNKIEEALEDFKKGKPLVVADDEDRENAVCILSVFLSTICGKSNCFAIVSEIARQTMPLHSFVIKLIKSGVTN